jgi:hypothetical protein
MTEEKARHDAKTLAQGMDITFYRRRPVSL